MNRRDWVEIGLNAPGEEQGEELAVMVGGEGYVVRVCVGGGGYRAHSIFETRWLRGEMGLDWGCGLRR